MQTKSLLEMRKLFLILFLPFVLVSCHRQISCPEFKDEILRWIPYQENDMIVFYSYQNDSTISFLIKNAEVNHTTHYTTGYKCGTCDDYIFVYSENNDNQKFNIDIHLNTDKLMSQSYYIGDSYFAEYNSTFSEENNYLFEGNKYDLVRIFEQNDSKGMFKKLILVKDFGVIGLVDIFGNTWTLKTDTKIKRLDKQEKNIKINYVSC